MSEDLSQLEEQIKRAEELLKEQKRTLGPDDFEVMLTHLNLGQMYFDARRYEESLKIMQDAIKLVNKIFPKGNPMSAPFLDHAKSVIEEIHNLRK